MTAHNLPYVHRLLCLLSKSPIMQFLCTAEARFVEPPTETHDKRERERTNERKKEGRKEGEKTWIQHRRLPLRFCTTAKTSPAVSALLDGAWRFKEPGGRGRARWAFCLDSSWTCGERQSGDGPHPPAVHITWSDSQKVSARLPQLRLLHIHCCCGATPFLPLHIVFC